MKIKNKKLLLTLFSCSLWIRTSNLSIIKIQLKLRKTISTTKFSKMREIIWTPTFYLLLTRSNRQSNSNRPEQLYACVTTKTKQKLTKTKLKTVFCVKLKFKCWLSRNNFRFQAAVWHVEIIIFFFLLFFGKEFNFHQIDLRK